MSDRIFIRALELPTVIGVYGWEREVRQVLLLDLEMAWDITAAAANDDVSRALDYAAVSTRLRDFAADSSFHLLEAMAEALATLVMREFSVPWLRLRLCKPGAVSEAHDVGVLIERGDKHS